MILGLEDFLAATAEPPESLAALQEEARRRGKDKLTLEDIEREIAEVRQSRSK